MSGPPSNIIQIKRSTSNAVVTGLSNGELAFTQASNTLFIGLPDGSGVVAIGGARYPGTLTANQALVANSSSAIDKVIVANAVITSIYANGAVGTTSQILGSNSSGGLFWRDAGSLGTNVDAQFAWTNTQTFSNTITFNGAILANTVNAVSHTSAVYGDGTGGFKANSTFIGLGNSAVSVTINSTSFSGTANNALYLGGTLASSYATQSYVTTQGYITSAALSGYATESYVTSQGFLANIAGSGNVAYDSSRLGGTAAVNFVQNTDSRTLSGNLYLTGANTGFSTGYFIGGQPGAVANSVSANSIAILIGNSSINATINSTAFTGSANAATYLNSKTESNLNVNSALTANAATYLNGKTEGNLNVNSALTANATTYVNGKTESNLNVNNALTANAASYLGGNTASDLRTYSETTATNAYTWAMANTLSRNGSYTGNNTLGGTNTVISSNLAISGSILSNIVPAANVTYNLGSTGLRYNQIFSSNVTAEYITVGKDLSVSGNLYVTGTVAYINTTSFSTTDSLLQFASNNTVTDVLDIGFFGQYLDTATVKYTGLFRDATDGTYALFAGLTEAPSATVNTAAASYGYASLKTYITSSALIANSTQTNITANSTVSVAVTANTLNFDKIDAGTF